MKAVILAGGLGSRLGEETDTKPKPMVEIGRYPILWHVMKIYSYYGVNDFVICLGYKGYVIKEYFSNYYLHMADVTFDMRDNTTTIHENSSEPWKVTLVDTGEASMTGGRLRRIRKYLGQEDFCFTYGDGLADIDIDKLVGFHRQSGRLATVSIIQPPGRFGTVKTEGDAVEAFIEKPDGDGGWINGGFFVLSPAVLDLIEGDAVVWEKEPLERLATDKELAAFRHTGFWYAMDTLRDKNHLNQLWNTGAAPWKIWD